MPGRINPVGQEPDQVLRGIHRLGFGGPDDRIRAHPRLLQSGRDDEAAVDHDDFAGHERVGGDE
jgi:hypothetical protein